MVRTYAACDRWIGQASPTRCWTTAPFSAWSLTTAARPPHTAWSTWVRCWRKPGCWSTRKAPHRGGGGGEGGGGGGGIDWTKTKAAPLGVVNIFVNLEGEPTGIVEPGEEYEQVRRDIIHALYEYRHPETGYCPFTLAVRREDAEVVNYCNDLAGDVVYAVLPEFDGAHGHQLPQRPPRLGLPAHPLRPRRRRRQTGRPPGAPGAPGQRRAHIGLHHRLAHTSPVRRTRRHGGAATAGLAPGAPVVRVGVGAKHSPDPRGTATGVAANASPWWCLRERPYLRCPRRAAVDACIRDIMLVPGGRSIRRTAGLHAAIQANASPLRP